MSLSIGIVGLPNVGKSTLFTALTRKGGLAANYPFATIDPNVGIVDVPDARLQKLAEIVNPGRIMPATVEFVDIAGLVKGANEGEGLGNQFLANIRNTDAICEVVRYFKDPDVIHVEGRVNPDEDVDIIQTELILADLGTIERALPKLEKEAKRDRNGHYHCEYTRFETRTQCSHVSPFVLAGCFDGGGYRFAATVVRQEGNCKELLEI